jgi:hypothetical protein
VAHLREVFAPPPLGEALVFADAWDIHLGPTVGGAWRPRGPQLEGMTPGRHQQHDRAGALELTAGALHSSLGPRKTAALYRDLSRGPRSRGTVDAALRGGGQREDPHSRRGGAVAGHPRGTLRCLPTYGPRANPIERAFGAGHDCGTRNPQRQRLPALVADVQDHVQLNGPWQPTLSALDDAPAVPQAVEKIVAEEQAKVAA